MYVYVYSMCHSSVTILISLVYCYLINRHNSNFLTCAKAEKYDLTVCIVVNEEKVQTQAVTLTLIGQCPIWNSS